MGFNPATLLKKSLWHRCFPVNFVKFERTIFLQSTSGRLVPGLYFVPYEAKSLKSRNFYRKFRGSLSTFHDIQHCLNRNNNNFFSFLLCFSLLLSIKLNLIDFRVTTSLNMHSSNYPVDKSLLKVTNKKLE